MLSTRPYLIRAIYEWCVDAGFTPHILVHVDEHTRVPAGYVKDGQIVLNLSSNAVRDLAIDNDWVHFSARFSGKPQEIAAPINRIAAIFARENGQGMHFEVLNAGETGSGDTIGNPSDDNSPQPPKGRPQLKVVK
jgi:stringent starvation protein B